MVSSYHNNPKIFIQTIFCISLICVLMLALNFFLNSLIKKRKSLDYKKYNRRRETYELRVNSIRTVNTVNTLQSLILALLFLLFNIKITLLIPMILSLKTLGLNKQIIVIIYIVFIMLSVYIKITSNIILFYKNKKVKYLM